jgi:hypothetical protein
MRASCAPQPIPLPFQALDQATGYLTAAAAIRGLADGSSAAPVPRRVLARTAKLLIDQSAAGAEPPFAAETEADWSPTVEATAWEPARRFVRRPKSPAHSWRGPILRATPGRPSRAGRDVRGRKHYPRRHHPFSCRARDNVALVGRCTGRAEVQNKSQRRCRRPAGISRID